MAKSQVLAGPSPIPIDTMRQADAVQVYCINWVRLPATFLLLDGSYNYACDSPQQARLIILYSGLKRKTAMPVKQGLNYY